MGIKEENDGTALRTAAVLGEPWFLLTNGDGTDVCCHRAPSWFDAREIARALTGEENVQAQLMYRSDTKQATDRVEQVRVLREALSALVALPTTGPGCARSSLDDDEEPPHDPQRCDMCAAEREYMQRCDAVYAQANAALAATETEQ